MSPDNQKLVIDAAIGFINRNLGDRKPPTNTAPEPTNRHGLLIEVMRDKHTEITGGGGDGADLTDEQAVKFIEWLTTYEVP